MDETGHSQSDESSRPPSKTYFFVLELSQGSDRAAAVLAQAKLEERIRISISQHLTGSDKQKVKLIGSRDAPGVLGFSDQCRLAHGLGIVDADELSDLFAISRIRNRFGHAAEPLSFSDRKIKDRINSLKTLEISEPLQGFVGSLVPEPRQKYIRCCLAIWERIITRDNKWLRYQLSRYKQLIQGVAEPSSVSPTAPDQPTHSQESPPEGGHPAEERTTQPKSQD